MSTAISTTRSAADRVRLAQATTQSRVQDTMARLSTGLRIGSAKDWAGVSESVRLGTQVRGIAQAAQGMEESASIVQMAQGGLGGIAALLSQQRELAMQASTTSDPTHLQEYDAQMKELGTAIDRIATTTAFKGTNLLDGTFKDQQLQVDVLNQTKASITIASTVTGEPTGFDRAGLGVDGVSTATAAAAQEAMDTLDTALQSVASQRSVLGALQTRMSTSGLDSLAEMMGNLSQAQSHIMDADFASETVEMTRSQILVQNGVGMLNASSPHPQTVLNLLR